MIISGTGRRFQLLLPSMLLVVLALQAAGCGGGGSADEPERLALQGKITHDGQPVPAGDLSFAPDTARGNKGPAGAGTISNGTWQTVEGKGPTAGPQVVTISGYGEGTGEDAASGPPVLFSDYRMEVDLSAGQETLDIEVPAEE